MSPLKIVLGDYQKKSKNVCYWQEDIWGGGWGGDMEIWHGVADREDLALWRWGVPRMKLYIFKERRIYDDGMIGEGIRIWDKVLATSWQNYLQENEQNYIAKH